MASDEEEEEKEEEEEERDERGGGKTKGRGLKRDVTLADGMCHISMLMVRIIFCIGAGSLVTHEWLQVGGANEFVLLHFKTHVFLR